MRPMKYPIMPKRDINPAIMEVYKRSVGLPNLHVISASIFAIPFRDGAFGFVWSNGVVGVAKVIEHPLLNVAVGGRGLGRPGFEGFVHAFVGAVLLGLARCNALVSDAEL